MSRYIDGAVLRTARKQHFCQAQADTYPQPEKSRACRGRIQPGERYVEYLGETAAYQSGKHFCLACANFSLAERTA